MFSVTIAWGTEGTRAGNPIDTAIEYTFDTEDEKSAFLDGVDACLELVDINTNLQP
jgi:hypothetical protein